MDDRNEPDSVEAEELSRRGFLKYGAALGGAVAVSGLTFQTASAVDLKRTEAGGKVRVLGCNPMTSTDGYWDNSTPPVLEMNSGDIVEIETGTHLMGRMVPGADILVMDSDIFDTESPQTRLAEVVRMAAGVRATSRV